MPQTEYPTAQMVAENPGAYEGTSYDVTNFGASFTPLVASRLVDKDGNDLFARDPENSDEYIFPQGIKKMFEFWRWNRSVARRYFEKEFGFPLNEKALSFNQKIKMGV